MIGAVDWHLLLLFVCLFGVTAAFAKTGLAQDGLQWLAQQGLLPDRLAVMTPLTLVTSNTIGNVPTVILILKLLPGLSHGALAGLALLSTFAGNLLLTGSLCNIIVAERAAASRRTPELHGFRPLRHSHDARKPRRRRLVAVVYRIDELVIIETPSHAHAKLRGGGCHAAA